MMTLTPEMLRGWYHSIELQPGLFTSGLPLRALSNIAIVRKILGRCEVQDATCLDIGTMEGLFSVLLHRRGARRVFACDRYDLRNRIDIVCDALRIPLTYLSRVTLADARRMLPHLVADPFDLIIFSGVLYHMYDPMTGIALVRSMLRPGGIAIIETAAYMSRGSVSYFNVRGKNAADVHNYWMMSVELLDYLLRYFRLKALDCAFLPVNNLTAEDGSSLLRVCVACEAVKDALAEPPDEYMNFAARDDAVEFPDWLTAKSATPLRYQITESRTAYASGALNLFETISATAATDFCDDDAILSLGAQY
jgi:SAM-dependent methyltransferase